MTADDEVTVLDDVDLLAVAVGFDVGADGVVAGAVVVRDRRTGAVYALPAPADTP